MDGIRIVRGDQLSAQTAQTPGMLRKTAIDGNTVGASSLWVGRVTIEPGVASGAHYHGDCESAIFVISGHARFRFGERLEDAAEAGPGDYIFVPPHCVHQEINASDTEPIDCIVVRDSQENVVVNVEVSGA